MPLVGTWVLQNMERTLPLVVVKVATLLETVGAPPELVLRLQPVPVVPKPLTVCDWLGNEVKPKSLTYWFAYAAPVPPVKPTQAGLLPR